MITFVEALVPMQYTYIYLPVNLQVLRGFLALFWGRGWGGGTLGTDT